MPPEKKCFPLHKGRFFPDCFWQVWAVCVSKISAEPFSLLRNSRIFWLSFSDFVIESCSCWRDVDMHITMNLPNGNLSGGFPSNPLLTSDQKGPFPQPWYLFIFCVFVWIGFFKKREWMLGKKSLHPFHLKLFSWFRLGLVCSLTPNLGLVLFKHNETSLWIESARFS